MKRATAIVIALVIGLVALGLEIRHELFYAGYDIFDKFHVVKVVPEPGTDRYAVIHDYEHADSSTRVTAIWIKTGEVPYIGSTDPVVGYPIVAWRGTPDSLATSWYKGRLVVTPPSNAALQPNNISNCYFEEGTALLCYESEFVDIKIPNP